MTNKTSINSLTVQGFIGADVEPTELGRPQTPAEWADFYDNCENGLTQGTAELTAYLAELTATGQTSRQITRELDRRAARDASKSR
jgi:hypothetical protein